MTVYFLILAHNDPDQLERLINRIADAGRCLVHLDKKADESSFVNCRSQAVFIENRVNVRWGGVSVVKAMLNLMEAALILRAKDECLPTHFVFLSGSCYPIKESRVIESYFSSYQGSQLMNLADVRLSPGHHEKSLRGYWFYDFFPTSGGFLLRALRGALQKTLNGRLRKWPKFFDNYYYGSQWIALTPECAAYVVNYLAHHAGVLKYFTYSLAPDEMLIHSIVGNSSYKDTCRFCDGDFGVWELANFHLIHESLSKWYDINDFDDLYSSKMMFVRKLSSGHSLELVKKIDVNLLIQD